jgi:hypothetical protein
MNFTCRLVCPWFCSKLNGKRPYPAVTLFLPEALETSCEGSHALPACSVPVACAPPWVKAGSARRSNPTQRVIASTGCRNEAPASILRSLALIVRMLSTRVFGGREENQNREILDDTVKSVLHVGCHIDDRTRLDRLVLVSHSNVSASADHIIDFILRMRLLWISSIGRQAIKADAERRDAQKLQVEAVGSLALFDHV